MSEEKSIRYIDAYINIDDYDLKKILSIVKNNIKKKSLSIILSIIKKAPEKLVFSVVNSKITQKKIMPKTISKINKILNRKGICIMVDNISLDKTGKKSLDISLKLHIDNYSEFLPLIEKTVNEKIGKKFNDERLTTIINTAISVIFSDIPDEAKDTVINNIIKNTSTDISSYISDLLKKKDLPISISDISVKISPEKDE